MTLFNAHYRTKQKSSVWTSETKRELLGINMRGVLAFEAGARHTPRNVYAWDRISEVNVDNVIHPQKLLVALR